MSLRVRASSATINLGTVVFHSLGCKFGLSGDLALYPPVSARQIPGELVVAQFHRLRRRLLFIVRLTTPILLCASENCRICCHSHKYGQFDYIDQLGLAL